MKRRILIIFVVISVLFLYGTTAFADALPDMTPLRKLFGESGVISFHLDSFSMENIDFDTLLRIVGSSSIDYSSLNFDEFLKLLNDPEVLGDLGIASIDENALRSWLQNPATGVKLNDLMITARQGRSFSDAVKALSEDPEFLASFSAITNGVDFSSVMNQLASGSAPNFLNKAATALLRPRSGSQSETARTLSNLIQNASVTLGWKR